jgi:hypothetical protein
MICHFRKFRFLLTLAPLLLCQMVAAYGRCERPWLPFLDTSGQTSNSMLGTMSQPKIVDLISLAANTDRRGLKDMISSRMGTHWTADTNLAQSNILVKGTYTSVAISVRLQRKCDRLLENQPGWSGKIAISGTRKAEFGTKLPNSCSLVYTPARGFTGESIILYNTTESDDIFAVVVQVLPCQNEPKVTDDWFHNVHPGITKRLDVLQNDDVGLTKFGCIAPEKSTDRINQPTRVHFTNVANKVGIRANQSDVKTAPNCIFPSYDGRLKKWDEGAFCVEETLTGGACVGDIDGDGVDDLYYPRMSGDDILYRNRRDGTFEDVTKSSGIGNYPNMKSNGCHFVDIDNDGDNDIYISTVGDYRFYLFVNDGTGRFTEEALERGLDNTPDGRGSLTAGFTIAIGDYNLDGALDILTTEWLPWLDREGMDHDDVLRSAAQVQTNARLFANDKENPGRFRDVTKEAGLMPEVRAPRDKFISSVCSHATKLDLLNTIHTLGDGQLLTAESSSASIRRTFEETLTTLLLNEVKTYLLPPGQDRKNPVHYKYAQFPRSYFKQAQNFEIRIEAVNRPVHYVISGKEEKTPVFDYKDAIARGSIESGKAAHVALTLDMDDPYGVRSLNVGLYCETASGETESCTVELTMVANNPTREKYLKSFQRECDPQLESEEQYGMFTVPKVAPWVRSEMFIAHATSRMRTLRYQPHEIRKTLRGLFKSSTLLDAERKVRIARTEARIRKGIEDMPATIEKYELVGKFEAMNTPSTNGERKQQMMHIAQFPMVGAFQFGAKIVDLDNDGYPDIVISGDFGTSSMLWNNRNGTFSRGTFDFIEDVLDNSMGATVGDWDMDGLLDIMFTSVSISEKDLQTLNSVAATAGMLLNFRGNHLYKNLGNRRFSDVTESAGVRESGWGWGAFFWDVDNDGDLDALNGNGMDDPETTDDDWAANQRMRLYINQGAEQSFAMHEEALNYGLADINENRGAMAWDYDEDGDLDVFVVNHGAPPSLYRNDGGNYYDFLRVKVYEANGRESIGARVYVDIDPPSEDQPSAWDVNGGVKPLVREISNQAAFLGQSEAVAHFGLGKRNNGEVWRVRVEWPPLHTDAIGQTSVYYHVPVRTTFVIRRETMDTFSSPITIVSNAGAILPMCETRKIVGISAPSNGDAFISESRRHLTYHPLASFQGEDSFTYTINDGLGGSTEGTIRIQVKPSNTSTEADICLASEDAQTCSSKSKLPLYRPLSGRGYNLKIPWYDAPAFTILLRHSQPAYADGYEDPAGTDRPSARLISNQLFTQTHQIFDENGLNDLNVHMGQLVAHDMSFVTPLADFTAQGNFAIHIPKGDVTFDPKSTGIATMRFRRSGGKEGTGKKTKTPKQQVNKISGWLDLGVVYGSSLDRSNSLRAGYRGLLKSNNFNDEEQLTYNTRGMPNLNLLGKDRERLLVSGDNRVNVQPGLLSFHTLWAREHNRWATRISNDNPTMSDETIFQAARRRTIAVYQNILMYEWLPLIVGKQYWKTHVGEYKGYNSSVDPRISNEFATCAFRFGHTQASDTLQRLGPDLRPTKAGPLHLKDTYFTPERVLTEGGLNPIVRGMICKRCQAIDTTAADGIRNHLFSTPTSGFDLVALNIQRGRDHGLTDYNSMREAYGLARKASFEDISSKTDVQRQLKDLYKNNLSNIDAFVGGLAEDHALGASLGELFSHIVADQFRRTRDGDAYWFENVRDDEGETLGFELADFKSETMLSMLQRNTNLPDLSTVGGSHSAFRIGNEDGNCGRDVEICTSVSRGGKLFTKVPSKGDLSINDKHRDAKKKTTTKPDGERTLREKVLDRYQRAVEFFNDRADNAQKVIEEATARGISPEKLLKHMDKKYPYGAPSEGN